MDTEISKLIQALRGISNKLEEIYGEPRENNETKENIERSNTSMPVQGLLPVVQTPERVQQMSNTTEQVPAKVDNQLVYQGSFETAPVSTAFTPQVVESDADKIKRLEHELSQMKHQNINFNFAPTNIGGTYGQSNY